MRAGWSAADIPDLSGRVAIVTGANRGLGGEITRYLAGRGARVIMACRDEAGGEAAVAALRAGGVPGPLEVRPLDLASLASVEKFAAGLAGEPRLDVLANNAGLMAVDRGLTEDGFETHIGVNHLGHFALTARLLPLLLATGGSRVVTMSSMGARLGHHGRSWTNRLVPLWTPFLQPASVGALGLVRAATDPAAQGGEYYGPRFQVWGPPVRETPSRRARDPALAARLWEQSEGLTGCRLPL